MILIFAMRVVQGMGIDELPLWTLQLETEGSPYFWLAPALPWLGAFRPQALSP